ncbi:competence protein ComEA [Microbacterium sp. ru370.1]|uniref:helix-hairpin-helix domain-containing protein n=1 Tax=unclassified Microbacterium TaxID=2609290 RepID=UPI000884D57B|nr:MULTISPECIES: helix-hairpin-helix domain-containing protein [unclassified Microbacterium]SDO78563.1 competence protein ComEA [Microbacterium sp. ru370.1]SIT89199.1 competence protein ComEA [Microbacterium sp. RU1D]
MIARSSDAPDAETPGARRKMGVGAVIVLILAAFAITIATGMFRGATGAETVTPGPSPSRSAVVPAQTGVYVHVAGAVHRAGLYRLDAGGRVADAVARAGGFADDADRDGVNLARTVTDGEQIVVPVRGAAPVDAGSGSAGGGGAGSGGASGGSPLIDLNTATREQLDTLPRVGPAMADRIIAWRQENGRFTSVDDLLSVPGIGDKMLAAIRDLVRV